MIKIFKNIRKNLLAEGKTTKYLEYAIGEIFLVVFGILIALQINTWNEDYQNSNKETVYLMSLKDDLEKQIDLFNNNNVLYLQLISTGESILADYIIKDNLSEIDSINKKLSFMMYSTSYPEISTTFNELNTTGQLKVIKEKALRSMIIKYYQDSESAEEIIESNKDQVIYKQIFPILKSSVIIDLENFNFTSEIIDNQALTKKLSGSLKNLLDNPNKEFENNQCNKLKNHSIKN